MGLDEPREDDAIYEACGFRFIINQEEAREIPYIEIDYGEAWTGEGFIVTSGF
jgi:Fe-S cluster assembly iron-binding protein IscA